MRNSAQCVVREKKRKADLRSLRVTLLEAGLGTGVEL